MFDKLTVLEKRYEELNQKLYDPAVAADPGLYGKLMKEVKTLEPIVYKYGEYKKAVQSVQEALNILDEGAADRELRELAGQELDDAKKAVDMLTEELKILLLPKDPNDERNVIIEIRGGAGGEEAALFCAVLYRMYTMYAEKRGFQTELLNANETQLGGYKEISFMVTGEGAYSRFRI